MQFNRIVYKGNFIDLSAAAEHYFEAETRHVSALNTRR